MSFNRRELLIRGVASALTATFPTEIKAQTRLTRQGPVDSRSSDPLVVTLGAPINLTFSESDATELTPWVNADYRINQKVKVVARGDWRVYFRPEADGSREEVVVEYGILAYPGNPTNVGAYTATITKGGKTLATINVPVHFYFSRWRWQSAPRHFVARVSALIASGLLPPFGLSGIRTWPSSWKANKPYVIMGNAGIDMAMGTTGERPDIGLVTEHQARAIMHVLGLPSGNADAIAQVMDQAEASGTIPMHWRDQHTGRPVNIFDADRFNMTTHPNDTGHPQYMNWGSGTGWELDINHYPALSYFPYLLTGDLYHLEELQFVAAWSVARFSFNRNLGFGQQFWIGQARGFAWGLRHLFQAAHLSPANGTEYLLPKSFFTKILENTHAWFKSAAIMLNPDPAFSVFHCLVKTSDHIGDRSHHPEFAPWESAFLAAVLGWAQVLGFKDWSEVYLYVMDNFVQMNNGRSGWNRYLCIPYRFWLADFSGAVFTSYSQAYKGYIELAGAKEGNVPQWIPTIPDRLYCPAVDSSLVYPSYMRAAYVYGLLLGYKQFEVIYDWLHATMVYEADHARAFLPKWELVP
jgi:hypothetical protein